MVRRFCGAWSIGNVEIQNDLGVEAASGVTRRRERGDTSGVPSAFSPALGLQRAPQAACSGGTGRTSSARDAWRRWSARWASRAPQGPRPCGPWRSRRAFAFAVTTRVFKYIKYFGVQTRSDIPGRIEKLSTIVVFKFIQVCTVPWCN